MRKYKLLLVAFTALCSLIPALVSAQVDTVWVRTYNGPANGVDGGRAIAVDEQGNVYVTGISYGTFMDYATVKYNSAGVQEWAQRYNGPGNAWDWVKAIAVDGQGNVYVTGESYDSGTANDYATIKYNTSGVEQWVQRYNGPGNSDDMAYALAVDGSGNVYVTGYSTGDYATIKYNSSGVQQWLARYNGPENGDDEASAIAIDDSGYVYVTGFSVATATSADITTIKYVQTSGIEEIASLPLAKTSGVEVYPNPAKAFFTIRSSFLALHSTLKLYDVTGKEVKSEVLKANSNRISLDGIKNGVYFVKVGDEMEMRKLAILK